MGRIGPIGDTRELVVRGLPYIVVHLIEDGEIAILAVMPTARLWPRRF